LQAHNPRIVTNGLIYHLDPTNGGKGGSKVIAKPTVIDNCILWLDADDKESIVESSNLVSNWLDKSGEGNHAAQGTSTNQPTYTAGAVNGRATISFDGTDNHMDIAGLSGTTFGSNGGVTFFMVVRQVAFDNNGAGFYFGGQSGDPTTQNYMGCGTSGGDSMDFRMYGPDGTGGEMQTYYQDTGGYNIHAGLWDKTNVSIYFNGYLGGTTTSNVTSSNWTTDEPAKIAESSGTTYTKMNISEIILFNRNLSDTERQRVERYLSLKWAIPLRATVTTNLADGAAEEQSYDQFGQSFVTHNNTFYFPNPDDDNCDLRLEANEIAIADNLPWTIEFWIKRHARGPMGPTGIHAGVWGNSYSSSNFERMQFEPDDDDVLAIYAADSSGGPITNIVDLDCLHKWRHVVLAFDGTTDATTAGSLRQYVDGSDKGPAIALDNADSGITIKRLGSRGHLTDAHRLEGELGNFRVYNKQLSHAEVLQNYNAQRAKYQNEKMSFVMLDENTLTSDFSAGTDGWGAGGGGVAGNIDGIGPADSSDDRNDCLRFTCNTVASTHYMLLPGAVHGASVGDSIRITFDYFVPAGQSHVDGIGMGIYGPQYPQPYYSTMNTTDAWTSVDVTFEVSQAYGLIIYGLGGVDFSFTDTGNDVFYIRNFKYHRPPGGLRLYLDAQSGTSSNYYADGTWYDISGGTAYNAAHSNATHYPTLSNHLGVKYYAFDGTNDKFVVGEVEGVFAEVTFSLWVFKAAQVVSYGNIFDCSRGEVHANRGPRLECVASSADPSTIGLYMGPDDAVGYVATSTNALANDEWFQVTYTIKTETNTAGGATSQTTKAYVDGILHTDTTRTDQTTFWGWDETVVNPTIPNLEIGLGYNTARYFTGGIANFMIYDTVLSADQIMQNYNYFKHRFGK